MVTYPQGWRATLNKLDVADEKGNNYQLLIFAPAAENKTLTRAAADNTADVTVQVQEGLFWAVDKIKGEELGKDLLLIWICIMKDRLLL